MKKCETCGKDFDDGGREYLRKCWDCWNKFKLDQHVASKDTTVREGGDVVGDRIAFCLCAKEAMKWYRHKHREGALPGDDEVAVQVGVLARKFKAEWFK